MKALYKNPVVVILIAITVALFVFLNEEFPTIDLSGLTFANIVAVLGYLSLVMLIVEQFIEIFVSDPQESSKIKNKSRIEEIHKELEREDLTLDQIVALSEEKDNIEKILLEKGLKRKQQILIINYGLGLLLAFSGFRIMSGFLFETALANGTEVQKIMIQSIDIILTAGIISGGSDRIHRLIKRIKANFKQE